MDEGRDAQDGGWLSLGAEAVPLRDTAVQTAKWERTERLYLMGKRPWPRSRLRAVICAASRWGVSSSKS